MRAADARLGDDQERRAAHVAAASRPGSARDRRRRACAMKADDELAAGEHRRARALRASTSVEQRAALPLRARRRAHRRSPSTAMTLFSDEQRRRRGRRSSSARSWPRRRARRPFRRRSPTTLPAPTPIAGVPLAIRGTHVGLRAGRDDQVGMRASARYVCSRRDRRGQLRTRSRGAPIRSSSACTKSMQQRERRMSFGRRRDDDRVAALRAR
mgnify:CR=1 FL=1